ncbi:MAG: hypothetical protein LKM38_04080 [Pseudomonas veronii]|nr:hypothetical protein [Pseudomonas veronii]
MQSIQPLPGSVQTNAVGLADNDTVALNSFDANQYPSGASWDSVNNTVAIAPLLGGRKSQLVGITRSGAIVYGTATDSTPNYRAVGATLP